MERQIVVYTEGKKGPLCGLDEDFIRSAGGVLKYAEADGEDERLRLVESASVMVLRAACLDARFFDSVPQLKGVVRTGIGTDSVDLAAATNSGVAVANAPGFCVEEVAEHAFALIFALSRKVALADRIVRSGEWPLDADRRLGSLRRLQGMTLGIVGLGRIGLALARRGRGLEMNVIACDPHLTRSEVDATNVPVVGLQELLRSADVVSLNVPLTAETHHLINASTLKLFKPDAVLINTSRGGVVDEHALLDALESDRLAGAGLDVLEKEPPPPDHPLFRNDRVVLTFHYASSGVDSYAQLKRDLSAQIAQILRGEFPTHLVNRELLRLPHARVGTAAAVVQRLV
jgi:D-3-phosphoglycerate dehydrogenase